MNAEQPAYQFKIPKIFFFKTKEQPTVRKPFAAKRFRKPEVIYPESDGQPMAENTKQYKKIVYVKENLERIFVDNKNVFIAADLFWYPVEFDNKTKYAPDVMVAFGRPKGDRRSYLQWEEGNIPPQVVFEILSPSNTNKEMTRKFRFYQLYGVEEYYVYDPDKNILKGWIRSNKKLNKIDNINGWTSPILGVRFEISKNDLMMFDMNGEKFSTLSEMAFERDKEKKRAELQEKRAEQEKVRAELQEKRAKQEKVRAEQQEKRAEQEKIRAELQEKRADDEKKRAEQEKFRAELQEKRADDEKKRAEQAELKLAALMKKMKQLNIEL